MAIPDNNFVKEAARFNPSGVLTGANFVAAAGHRLYLTTPRGLFVIDVHDPAHPRIAGQRNGRFSAQSAMRRSPIPLRLHHR